MKMRLCLIIAVHDLGDQIENKINKRKGTKGELEIELEWYLSYNDRQSWVTIE